MPIGASKLRVLIATTNGPVEVLLLTEEDAAIGRCVACIGGTTETADIAAAYHAFVVRPTGVIESRFGHSCYRLDVSGRIDAGSSWQLGVLAAHGLLAAGRLAQENDVADAVLWATGSVRPVDLTVGAVSHVPEKIANSLDRLKRERAAGRRVLLALPSANAAEVPPTLVSELAALGIETVALAHVQPLFDALPIKLPDAVGRGPVRTTGDVPVLATATPPPATPSAPAVVAAPRRRWIVPAAAAAVLLAIAGTTAVLLQLKSEKDSAVSPSPQLAAAPTPAPPPVRVALAPEHVPFVTEQDRTRIRDEYMPAADYKALATSMVMASFVSGQPSQEAADKAAMEACANVNASLNNRADAACDLYASGTVVVTHRNPPPMPREPWVARNPSVERPFVGAQIPLAAPSGGDQLGKTYPRLARSKALVLAPNGSAWYSSAGASPDESMRRSLERCGFSSGSACMVVAVDDTFVVPIPTSARVVGFYRPDALFGVPQQARDEVASRLAGAPNGWNAIAVGAGANLGVAVGADSERSAIDGALADCAKHDHDCRLVVLGPFLVEVANQDDKRAATPQIKDAPNARTELQKE